MLKKIITGFYIGPVLAGLVLLLSACENGDNEFFQGITIQTRGEAVKSFIVKIDNAERTKNPGLIVLAKELDIAGEAVVTVNGHRYEMPPVVGGLLGKIVAPVDSEHLASGLNRIVYLKGDDSDGYEIYDTRIASVEEKSARVVNQTYRIVGREIRPNISDFDFTVNYKDEFKRKESDLPDWARRGKVRFYRAGIDFEYVDRLIEMFREASINLVLLQVATPMDTNSEEYRRYKAFIDRCHENGIKVMFDGGAGRQPVRLNAIMLEEVIRRPEIKSWISTDEYGLYRWRGQPGRVFLPDLKNGDYLKEVLKTAEVAIDAGMDELYYDWAIGGTEDLMRFFLEVRKLSEKKGKNVTIYANTHGNILVNGVCDIDKSEGTAEPGLWNGEWVHNVAQARFYYATGDGWKPYRSKYGARRTYDHRQGMRYGWMRPIAEAAAFQSHFAIAETGNKLRNGWLRKDNDLALEIWANICRYNKFLADNEELYTDVETASRVGLLAPPQVPSFFVELEREPLYDALAEMNVIYDVLLLPRINAEVLAKYKAIVISDLPWIDDEKLRLIKDYSLNRGKIYTIGSARELQELSSVSSPSSLVREMNNRSGRKEILSKIRQLTGDPLIALDNAEYVMANVVKKKNTDRIILHFINYSKTLSNVAVTLNLDGLVENINTKNIRLLSPDNVPEKLTRVSIKNNMLKFTLPKLEIYDVVVIN